LGVHSLLPGQVCEHGCGSDFDTVPPDIHEWPIEFYNRVPIEGVGVAHVTTKPYACRYDSWTTEIVLSRYRAGTVSERVKFPGSDGSASSADEMHTYWCDTETLVLCSQGVTWSLHLINEDYMDRKFRELFGRPWLE
jgi:hypothetical protein